MSLHLLLMMGKERRIALVLILLRIINPQRRKLLKKLPFQPRECQKRMRQRTSAPIL
uniref:Uncharacterized protein n=1 Tax=Rhizophora mucronata TaxID=61149 RepID=A0A2P2Q1X7_RHIMU